MIQGFSSCFGAGFLSGGVLAGLSFAVKAVVSAFTEIVGIGIVSGRGGEKNV